MSGEDSTLDRRDGDIWKIQINQKMKESADKTDELKLSMAANTKKTDETFEKVNRLEVAMFSDSADNEFGTPGLMTTARRLNDHIDLVCKASRWMKRGLVSLLTIASLIITIGQAIGWKL